MIAVHFLLLQSNLVSHPLDGKYCYFLIFVKQDRFFDRYGNTIVFSIVIFSTPYVFFKIKSNNRNPTKCEIETYDETYDRLVTSKLQTTQMQEHL